MTICVTHPHGTTLSLVLAIPECIDRGFLATWTLKAQLRRRKNLTHEGLIADLDVTWDDPEAAQVLVITGTNTEKWPVCPAELDIRFTSVDGFVKRSEIIEVNIEHGVTK